jgi:hypothetical protein
MTKHTMEERKMTEEEAYDVLEEVLREMAQEGLIYDSGERTWSNRRQQYEIVWRATPRFSALHGRPSRDCCSDKNETDA